MKPLPCISLIPIPTPLWYYRILTRKLLSSWRYSVKFGFERPGTTTIFATFNIWSEISRPQQHQFKPEGVLPHASSLCYGEDILKSQSFQPVSGIRLAFRKGSIIRKNARSEGISLLMGRENGVHRVSPVPETIIGRLYPEPHGL